MWHGFVLDNSLVQTTAQQLIKNVALKKKHNLKGYLSEDRPMTIAFSIEERGDRKFLNFSTLLKIGCTLPLTSAECERSFSVITRLKIQLRSSMTIGSLCFSAKMNMHPRRTVDDEVAIILIALHTRKFQKTDLIFAIHFFVVSSFRKQTCYDMNHRFLLK